MLFDGRPDPPSLDLDVLRCPDAGGARPAQFEGETADGRPVYIRYDGGWLSVHVGEPGAADVTCDEQSLVYQAEIGPPFHGAIALAQISELTGIRFNGARLTFSESDYRERACEGLIDISGRRACWEVSLQLFFSDLVALHEDLRRQFPDLVVLAPQKVEPAYPIVLGQTVYLPDFSQPLAPRSGLFCICPRSGEVLGAFNGRAIPRPSIEDMFDLVVEFYFSESKIHTEHRDRELESLGIEAEEAPCTRGWLAATFLRSRPESRVAFEAVEEIAGRHFHGSGEKFDLLSGKALGIVSRPDWTGQSVETWCLATPNRYLALNKVDDRWVGWRPVTPALRSSAPTESPPPGTSPG